MPLIDKHAASSLYKIQWKQEYHTHQYDCLIMVYCHVSSIVIFVSLSIKLVLKSSQSLDLVNVINNPLKDFNKHY